MHFLKYCLVPVLYLLTVVGVYAQTSAGLPPWVGEFASRAEAGLAGADADIRTWRLDPGEDGGRLFDEFLRQSEGLDWEASCALGERWQTGLANAVATLEHVTEILAPPTVVPEGDIPLSELKLFVSGVSLLNSDPDSAGFLSDLSGLAGDRLAIRIAIQPCTIEGGRVSLGLDEADEVAMMRLTILKDLASDALRQSERVMAQTSEGGVDPVVIDRSAPFGVDGQSLPDSLRPEWAGGPDRAGRADFMRGLLAGVDISGTPIADEVARFIEAGATLPPAVFAEGGGKLVDFQARLLLDRIATDQRIRWVSISGSLLVNSHNRYHDGQAQPWSLLKLCSLEQPPGLILHNFVGTAAYEAIALQGCRLADLTIENAHIAGGINLQDAAIAGFVTLRNVAMGGDLMLQRMKAGEVRIEGLERLGPEVPGGTEGGPDINAYQIEVGGELTLKTSSARNLFLGRSRIGVLRVSDLDLGGEADLWGARIDKLFLRGGISIAEALTGWYLEIGDLIIEKRDLGVNRIGRIEFPFLRASGRLLMRDILTNDLNLRSAIVQDLEISCTAVDKRLWLGDVQARQSIRLFNVTAAYLDAHGSSGQVFQISSGLLSDRTEPRAAGSESTCAAGSEFEMFSFGETVFQNARLAMSVTGPFSVTRARIGTMMFYDNRGRLGPDSVVNLRNADIERLALGETTLARDSEGRGPALEVDGAKIGQIRIFDPQLDEWQEEESRRLRHSVNDEDSLARLYLDQILPATGIAGDNGGAPPAYSGTVYRQLREAALAAGYPGLEKQIAIAQNRHYTRYVAQTSLPSWAFYKLGDLVNSFGYDNGKGILILVVIWLAGFLILVSDSLIWWGRWLAARMLRSASPGAAARLEPLEPRPKLRLSGLFLSIDRTVPSLGLDNGFADPRQALMAGGANCPPVVSGRMGLLVAALYLQRLIAFVVIMLMVGGVFNLFQ